MGGAIFHCMKFLVAFMVTLFVAGAAWAESGAVKIRLCGAFEKPGNYLVSKSGVHLHEIIKKVRGIPLARTDIALVVDSEGVERIVDLRKKSDDSIIRGGEQIYLFEKIISQR